MHAFFLINAQLKTWSVALGLCLNIGVDPPDVVKTTPCARKECWIGEYMVWPLSGVSQYYTKNTLIFSNFNLAKRLLLLLLLLCSFDMSKSTHDCQAFTPTQAHIVH